MKKPTQQSAATFGKHGGIIGGIYQLKTHKDVATVNERMGICWMKDRLKRGDLLLCTKVAGDHYYSYILLTQYANAWKGIPGSQFGAYNFGVDPVHKVDRETVELLAAGESFHFEKTVKIDCTPDFLKPKAA